MNRFRHRHTIIRCNTNAPVEDMTKPWRRTQMQSKLELPEPTQARKLKYFGRAISYNNLLGALNITILPCYLVL